VDKETAVVKSDEYDLVRRAQAGDRGAFGLLVERYWPRLCNWLFHVTPDRHAAEDLAQESFLKALKGITSFAAGTDFGAWLFRIAHNNWATHRRRGMRDRCAFPDDVPGSAPGPAECAISREALADLQGAVRRLPTGYRAAFLLRAEHGLSFRDIAGTLNISAENARWRVWKARENLMESVATHLASD